MSKRMTMLAVSIVVTVGCGPSAPEPAAPVMPAETVEVEPVPPQERAVDRDKPTVDSAPPLVVAATDETVPSQADVNGKYADLIKVVHVPEDRADYGEFDDYGSWGPGMWAGAMQPAGYWVYVYPNWYIWRTSHEKQVPRR